MPFDRSFQRPAPGPHTLFLSDLHLGALSARAEDVLRFLRAHPAEVYVLVGDILDLWQPMLPHWSAQDQAVIDFFRARHASGARLIYIRGNHDPDPSRIPAYAALPAEHLDAYIHAAPTGQRFLVMHGDEADSRLIRLHAMTRLGSLIDHGLRRLDTFLSRLSLRDPEMRGFASWLLLAANALRYRGRSHERQMVDLARARGLDGVICGHFHIAALHDHFGLTYANCGDWVDSMTALLDQGDGVLRLIGGREAALGLPLPARHSHSDQKALTQ
ncbi:MAG: UDP-2,3-diacylglucosamine diphosphatase [Rhodobacteraceae bacterium]|nr:UDP-2,3-diacylglucosamine diphosphatase [Paracoccaceae bacterium]